MCDAESAVMEDLFRAAEAAAKTDVPVVIFGGDGKSRLAEFIRQKRGKPSLVVEAGLLPLDEQEMLLSKLGAVPLFVPVFQGEAVPRLPETAADADRTLKTAAADFKKAYITRILSDASWNQTKAAKILGIQRTYLSRLLRELQIQKEKG